MRADALVVMAKAPLPGGVKTRLCGALGPEAAAGLARALLVDQLDHIQQIGSAELFLAFAPPEGRATMEQLAPPNFQLFGQEGADLGARMQGVFDRLFRRGHKSIVLIGADLAPVPLRFFEQAYASLQSVVHRVVLGPSRDGGYYLVGCNQPTPELFSAMRWSHSAVFAETVTRLKRLKISYDVLPVWFDVDTSEDLTALRAELAAASLAATMPETVKFLSCLENGTGFKSSTKAQG